MTTDAFTPSPEPLSLQEQRKRIPQKPGVYRYYDTGGHLLYIGKAKDLRKRVNSYFTKNHLDNKTETLVTQIAHIAYTIVENEQQALVLENNLIKEYQPKYNIRFKDGKTYPYIMIKNERFPRVISTRNQIKDGSTYFGPYPSIGTMYAILRFLRDSYQLRTCKLHLSEANIRAGKFRPCLEYHIGRCKAPCAGLQTEEDYQTDIREIRQLLKGSYKAVIDDLKTRLDRAVAQLQFEKAHLLKERLEEVIKNRSKSSIGTEHVPDCEVVTIALQEGLAAVNHFRVQERTLVATRSLVLRPHYGETEAQLLEAALSQLAAEDEDFGKRILCNLLLPEGSDMAEIYQVSVPQRGGERKLIELSLKNCEVLLEEKLLVRITRLAEDPKMKLLARVQQDLNLKTLPRHIECFDNSNIQGYAPVSSCVVFRDGKPARRDYRVFRVKTVQGPDDFATMQEVVLRRYRRMQEEGQPLPDLVVIDGGKGQLSHARAALEELELATQIPLISIAKRLEEIYYPEDPVPLHIDKKSPTLRLLQHMRNEAHDTAISYHRKRRSQETLHTALTKVPGIGAATAKKLLKQLGSVKAVKAATLEELSQVVGPAKAAAILAYFAPNEVGSAGE
ncbi:MAG: excinuclease ABC subunit UvrC [Bacteroidetes bacterium]|nr:excinuclease ABC subunit UvrC [Bacteroidota bacterium]